MSFFSGRVLLSIAFLGLLLVFLGSQYIGLDAIGWHHGFNHPLEGWDHLLTMLAVGIWAAQMRGKAIWMLPLAFVSVMSLGGLAGAAGFAIPSAEGIILLSCAVFTVLITRKICFSTKINLFIVAFFAFFHGFAHGQEISASASLISYTLGFVVATLLLHGAGILVAKIIVLCIACLFTTLFSSSGKLFSVQSDGYGKVNLHGVVADIDVLELMRSHWLNIQVKSIGSNFPSSPPIKLTVTDVANLDIAENQLAQLRQLGNSPPSIMNRSGLVASVPRHCWGENQLSFQGLFCLHAHAFSKFANDSLSLLGFNGYYPNINNSPGISLLSNGVGLTSPPSSNKIVNCPTALTHRFPPNLRLIEDSILQLLSAKFQFGNSNFQILPSHKLPFGLQFCLYLGKIMDHSYGLIPALAGRLADATPLPVAISKCLVIFFVFIQSCASAKVLREITKHKKEANLSIASFFQNKYLTSSTVFTSPSIYRELQSYKLSFPRAPPTSCFVISID